MSIDVICQWCVFCDYPIFRQWVAKYRDKFGKVILYPSRHHGVIDLEEFAKSVFPETWVEQVKIDYGIQDWRQAETEPCLTHLESDWILFSEQDFFVNDWNKFWKDIEKAMKDSDAIGYWNATHFPYLHPCFFLLKREVFEKTKKDFSAHAEIPGADHFAMLTRDLESLGAKITKIQDLGWEEWKNMFHLGGITYPYQNFDGENTVIGVKNPEAFFVYNYFSRQAPVEQSPLYLELSEKVEVVLLKKYIFSDLVKSRWVKFFKLWE